MPLFTLRFANRSHSVQDWMVSIGDNFTLAPDYVRSVDVNINNNYTFRIVVSTRGGYAHADLTYTAHTNSWALATLTPNEWGFDTGNGIVTVRCFLENIVEVNTPSYSASLSVFEEDTENLKGSYPAYQLYKDDTGTKYCSSTKVKSHDVGALWVKACLEAHPGTSCDGKPWTSEKQSGTVWPD